MRWVSIAPGRVNLIGEHTDYCGLPVLPMALDRDVRIHFEAAGGSSVSLDSPLVGCDAFSFSMADPIERVAQGDWSNYVRAAAKGLIDHGVDLPRGVHGTVVGTVPLAAGLSSSSALVVAAALAFLHANDTEMDLLELAGVLARAERFVGLEGGGMDQAVCLHGLVGHAVRIDFQPTRVDHVAIPPGWRWVVAHSLVRAEKSGAAMSAYNDRAHACRVAFDQMAAALDWPDGYAYVDVVAQSGEKDPLHRAANVLERPLLDRFRHVVTEARRVDDAQRAIEAGRFEEFGTLMAESHSSLRDDYQVSIPELDEMVQIAERGGAAGARLTGAGFGGSMVALCDDRSLPAVMEGLAEDYYRVRGVVELIDVLFEARPADGARVANAGGLAPFG